MLISEIESKGYMQNPFKQTYGRHKPAYKNEVGCLVYDREPVWIGYEIQQSKIFKDTAVKVLDRVYNIPTEFESLIEEINYSKELLDLPDDWDSSGAKPVDLRLYGASIDLLVKYTIAVKQRFGVIIQTPEINACPSGSIDLSWRTKSARLLVNIKYKGDVIVALFYGDNYNSLFSRQGVLDSTTIDESFALWMKSLV